MPREHVHCFVHVEIEASIPIVVRFKMVNFVDVRSRVVVVVVQHEVEVVAVPPFQEARAKALANPPAQRSLRDGLEALPTTAVLLRFHELDPSEESAAESAAVRGADRPECRRIVQPNEFS